ncbi:unnamed protein product [Prorocentrum cordatum]|uniref:Uncharacterized protein n=1 Tax=Prorocentrum cordatum TaxID=2364126 RepID=A0ABN9YBU4_9DINO|nr:unnamed protein product [Polarella glacialis]
MIGAKRDKARQHHPLVGQRLHPPAFSNTASREGAERGKSGTEGWIERSEAGEIGSAGSGAGSLRRDSGRRAIGARRTENAPWAASAVLIRRLLGAANWQ